MSEHYFDDIIKDKLYNHSSTVPNGMWEKIAQEKDKKPVVFWWNNKVLYSIATLILVFGYAIYNSNNTTINTPNNLTTQVTNQTTNYVATENSNKVTTTANNLTQNNLSPTTPKNNPYNTFNNKHKVKASAIHATNNIVDNTKNNSINVASINNSNIAQPQQQTNLTDNEFDVFVLHKLLPKQAIQTVNTASINVSTKNITAQPISKISIIGCPGDDFDKTIFIEPYASADYTFKTINGYDNNQAFINKKDSAEHMKGGYTVGIRFGKKITPNITLKGGIQFSQINELLSLRYETGRKYITTITTKTVVDALGNITTVADTSIVLQIDYATSSSKNKYRNIELPLIIGYEFGKNNFKANVNAGLIVNLASWYKGSTLDTSYNMVPINSKGSDGVYKYYVSLSALISVSLHKQITDKISLFAEPYFRYNITNHQSSIYGYSQKFSAAGLNLGFRYSFKKKKSDD